MSAETTAELDVAGGKVTYAGTIAAAGSVTGRAEAAFADIAPLAALFGQPVTGGLSVSAEGTFAGADGLDLKVAGQGAGLDTGEAIVTRLLGGEPRFSASVSDRPDGTIAVADLSVEGAQVALSGGASLAGDTIDATLTGRIADLGVLADGTSRRRGPRGEDLRCARRAEDRRDGHRRRGNAARPAGRRRLGKGRGGAAATTAGRGR